MQGAVVLAKIAYCDFVITNLRETLIMNRARKQLEPRTHTADEISSWAAPASDVQYQIWSVRLAIGLLAFNYYQNIVFVFLYLLIYLNINKQNNIVQLNSVSLRILFYSGKQGV